MIIAVFLAFVASAVLLVALIWALDTNSPRGVPTRRQLRQWRRERADIKTALNRRTN